MKGPTAHLVIAVLTIRIAAAADAFPNDAWSVLTLAMDTGGVDAEDALMLLGAIDDQTARELLHATLRGKNGLAIASAAKGLTPAQCIRYLPELNAAALDPALEPKAEVLAAIGRAGDAAAAEALAQVGNQLESPTSGVAFGVLDHMGAVAESVLAEQAVSGQSAWVRETAASILRRKRIRSAVPVFSDELHDGDERVRVAGALGLAQWGVADGKEELKTAAKGKDTDDKVEALVALGVLGDPQAFRSLKTLIARSDEVTKGRVVWAIARSGNARLKAFVYQLRLQDKPEFRMMLAEKLFDPADTRDLGVLEQCLASGDEVMQLIAAERLLGTPAAGVAEAVVVRGFTSSNEQARYLALQLASRDRRVWPDLADRVSDPDPAVKVAALTAVGDLNQRERFEEVKPYLADERRLVSLTAARVLMSLDPNAARTVFESHVTSALSHVRIYSAAMLLAIARSAQAGQAGDLPANR